MEEKYVIGEYTFNTSIEYREAQEDVKKIEAINGELDIHDPEVALRLYNMIRNGEITFKSPIGEQFVNHVSDIVADKSVDLLEDKATVDSAGKVAKKETRLGAVVIVAAVLAFVYLGVVQIKDRIDTKRMASLQEQVSINKTDEAQANPDIAAGSGTDNLVGDGDSANGTETGGTDSSGAAGSEASATYDPEAPVTDKWDTGVLLDESTLTVLPDYTDLVATNGSFAGWVSIDDTEINYPVVQTNDNEFYLKRDFFGGNDSNGTLFVDYRTDLVNPTTNTIIYGHNMKSGKMFGSLKDYLTEEYYNSHKTVHFNTKYEKRVYEVVAVCLSQVEYKDEEAYRYYNFIHAETEGQFQAFYRNVQYLSVYGTDIDLTSSDEVLTLSTCNNYVEDGRLFLVCKRVG